MATGLRNGPAEWLIRFGLIAYLLGSKDRAGNGLISQLRWLLADGLIKLDNRRRLLRLEVPSHSEKARYRVKESSVVYRNWLTIEISRRI